MGRIDPLTRVALERFKSILSARYGPHLRGLYLFGRGRGVTTVPTVMPISPWSSTRRMIPLGSNGRSSTWDTTSCSTPGSLSNLGC